MNKTILERYFHSHQLEKSRNASDDGQLTAVTALLIERQTRIHRRADVYVMAIAGIYHYQVHLLDKTGTNWDNAERALIEAATPMVAASIGNAWLNSDANTPHDERLRWVNPDPDEY